MNGGKRMSVYGRFKLVKEDIDNELPIVYFVEKITPSSLVAIYKALGVTLPDPVGIKISTGEMGGNNYLKPMLIKDLAKYVKGTILECNTAYEGKRNTSKDHWETIRAHGFSDIAPCDIMDENGEISIPVQNGYHLKENIIGSHAKNYNSIIMLSHVKGHAMAGFGGALKNMSIGMASSNGKVQIHTGGKYSDPKKIFDKEVHTPFLESMVDADSSIMDLYGRDNIVYINIANNLSVDCDCDSNPDLPCMNDIGIYASKDPVAVDQVFIDAIYSSGDEGKYKMIERIESRNGLRTIECAEEKGLGSRKYQLVRI